MRTDGLTFKILYFIRRNKSEFPGPTDRIKLDGISSQEIKDRVNAMIHDELIALDPPGNAAVSDDSEHCIAGLTDNGSRLLDASLQATRKFSAEDLSS